MIGLRLCKMKNKFDPSAAVEDGYRDLSLTVLFTDSMGISILGEVQIHDKRLHELKLQVASPKLSSPRSNISVALTGLLTAS